MLVRRSVARWVACLVAGVLVGVSAQATEPCADEVAAMQDAYQRASQAEPPRYETVLPFVDAAFACLGPVATPAHARVSEYEAYLLLEMGRTEQLLLALERYFRDLAHAAPPNRHARQLSRYGFLLAQLNLHGESLAAYAEAAGLADRLTRLEAGRQLSETGEHFRELGRLVDAGRYFEAADSSFALSDRPARYHLATLRLRQARLALDVTGRQVQTDETRLERALVYLDEAQRVFAGEEIGRLHLPVVAICRAEVLRRLGRYADSAASLDRAEQLLYRIEDRADRWVLYYEERARTALRQGNLQQAEAAAVAFRVLADSTQTLDYQSRAHTLLGEVAEASGQPGLLDDAEGYYRRAMRFALESRARYGLMDVAPAAWVEGQRPFRALVRLSLRHGRHEEAFLALDASRARYFADLLASTRRQERLGARQRATLDSLYQRQEEARRLLDEAGGAVAERSRLTLVVQQAQMRIDSLTASAQAQSPGAPTPSLQAMQQVLRARSSALLTHVLFEDEGYVFALTPDTLVVAPLDIAALRAALGAVADWEPAKVQLDVLHELHQVLIEPVGTVLAGATSLVVVPEGPLVQVPFGLLTTAPHTAARYGSAPYLLRQFATSTSLSAGALVEDEARRPAHRSPLVALGRSFTEAPAAPPGTVALRSGEQLTPLPLVEAELRAARSHLGGELFLGEDATKGAFFEYGPEAQVLHIASHALVDAEAAMSGYILLAPDEPEQPHGVLYLSELRQASLAAELVVLSACSTAKGSVHLSEGMIGLQYAFQAAGARSVLATLWPVNDAAMSSLVADFYGHLADGLPKDRALQHAQLDYLDAHHGTLAHPFYWASLVLQGDPAPLAPSSRMPWGWLLGIGGVGVLFLLARHVRFSS